jgi:cell division protein FtsI/penicillin-binding protein 2/cell division protein FtsW (lipid II flippase)
MTALSWLWLLLGFVLPLLVFLILSLLIKFSPSRLLMLACGAALAPAITIWLLIFSSPYFSEGTQIAWTGVKATGSPLSIGGKPEESIVGWPTNAEEPQLVLHPGATGAAQLTLEIKGGGAFVFDEQKKQILNGESVSPGSTKLIGDYQIRVNRLGLSLTKMLSSEVEVLDAQGHSLAGFTLRENRTRSLRPLVANIPIDNVEDEAARERAVAAQQKLEEWAAGIWLFNHDGEKVQIVSRDSTQRIDLPGDTTLSVRWPTMNLTFDVSASRLPNGVAQEQLSFESPWRLASPLPPAVLAGCSKTPASNPSDLSFVLVGSARPCDIAFVLPLGGEAGELRQDITISSETAKFTTPDAVDNQQPRPHPPNVKVRRNDIGTSQLSRAQGPYTFDLATVKNLPSRSGTLLLILVAWAVFCGGLALALPRMIPTVRLIVSGLALVAWNLLCLRLLLSFRYALDPASLDKHAVEGVTLAFIGITVVPGLMLLIARLRADRFDGPANEAAQHRAMYLALGYLVALIVTGVLALYASARLWTELPDTYYVGIFDYVFSSSVIFVTIIAITIFFIAVHIRYLYDPDDDKGETKGVFASIFVSSWYLVEDYFRETKSFWEDRLTGSVTLQLWYFVGGIFAFLLFVILFYVARLILPGNKTAQEMSVPILFFLLTLLWLGVSLFFRSVSKKNPVKWTGYLVLAIAAIVMITGPSVMLPALIGDFGSIVPVLAIVFPLTWLLIIVLPTKARLCVILSVALIFGGGLFVYKNIEGLIIPFHKQLVSVLPASVAPYIPGATSGGRFFARLLNYKEGFGAQRFAITANSIVGGEGLQYQELLNGNQHTWENRAIAHQGGWAGMGFGRAPTRMSHVRQDTLQYDSVFSFFIVSEYGLIGGVLLMLLYALPLVLVFLGGRLRFDGGYAIAYIIATMFLLEALYHMGMNLGSFPMTGRNLPFLSVNSPTDLIRWTLLFCLAITVIFWRYKGGGKLEPESPSLITNSATEPPAPPNDSFFFNGGEPLVKYVLLFLFVPLLFVSAVLYGSWSVVEDEGNELKTYNYKAMMEDVRYYLQNGIIEYVDGRLKLKRDRLEDPDEKSFLEREIVRFNVEDPVEKEERFRKEYITELNQTLRAVRSLAEYNAALRELAHRRPPETRRNIFQVKVKTDEEGNPVEKIVEPNSDFNVSFSFQDDLVRKGGSTVSYGNEVIIGPAWIRGRVRSVANPDAKLPWVAQLRDAVLSEEGRALQNGASGLTLSLSPALHEAASDFVTAKGVQLHEALLASQRWVNSNEPLAYVKNLPQRVALSVLDLKDGKTLALAGWPRMTSTQRQWVLSSIATGSETKTFWVPTNQWLEREAPGAFRTRYGGERNFDRALVMGSSTKPIWAAAVLRTHPDLGQLLHVRGAGGEEGSAFAIRFPGRGWQLNSRTDDWVGLDDYLRTSDNRYHVRLGLLGLSSGNGTTVNSAGRSGSMDESLSPTNEPWGMYPAFVTPIKVVNRSGQLEMSSLGEQPNQALANSELAKNLRGMFSIGINRVQRGMEQVSEFGPRRSFWTKDESSDLVRDTSLAVSAFDSISPYAPDFAFDSLTLPRDYITMLLGGGNNLWSNVDLAAAFGSCVTGKPVIAHIVVDDRPITTLPERQRLNQTVAAMLRPGLNAVVEREGGTAYNALHSDSALSFLRSNGVKIYAKTGTLKANENAVATSRIVLALVRWKNEAAGEVQAGLVFSLVAEEARGGTATNWLREFILANEREITRLLDLGDS